MVSIFVAMRIPLDYFVWRQRAKKDYKFLDSSISQLINDFWRRPVPENIEKKISEARNDLFSLKNIFPKGIDLGAGPKKKSRRSLASIVQQSSISSLHSQVIFNTIQYLKPSKILELGTGLGISTLYMALANPEARIITIEGNKDLAEQAKIIFNKIQLQNIQVEIGSFEENLPDAIYDLGGVELAFIDGDHTFQGLIKNTETITSLSKPPFVLIFDDIRWSNQMLNAWRLIQENPYLRLNIDLYSMGVSFCINYPQKENVWVRI